jgi:CheY-like chemotaxis protein
MAAGSLRRLRAGQGSIFFMATILIVHDNPEFATDLESILCDDGHRTRFVGLAKDAVKLLEGDELIHLLITGIGLHVDGMPAAALARQAVKLRSRLKILSPAR